MKTVEQCECPKCKSKLLFCASVLTPDDVLYRLSCVWCHWDSKIYKTETEAIENYETEIF